MAGLGNAVRFGLGFTVPLSSTTSAVSCPCLSGLAELEKKNVCFKVGNWGMHGNPLVCPGWDSCSMVKVQA